MKPPFLTKPRDAASRRWNDAMTAALAPGASAGVRVESALVVIDAHLNGMTHAPGMWGDVEGVEILFCELLFLRALLLGVEPDRYGGATFRRAKRKAFRSDNGPCSNWIGRMDFKKLTPLLVLALRAERKRHGVPSKVPVRRRSKARAAQ